MSAETGVFVWGGTAASASLSCRSCHQNFLHTGGAWGGEWGDEPDDVTEMRADELAALLTGHECPVGAA